MFNQMNILDNKFNFFMVMLILPLYASSNTELPDPTRPATFNVEVSEPVFFEENNIKDEINWKLTAIRISAADKTAILNGKLVRIGDGVGPAKILEINPLSVVINHEDKKLIVRLFKNPVIKNYKSPK
jgi:hypothetical protein